MSLIQSSAFRNIQTQQFSMSFQHQGFFKIIIIILTWSWVECQFIKEIKVGFLADTQMNPETDPHIWFTWFTTNVHIWFTWFATNVHCSSRVRDGGRLVFSISGVGVIGYPNGKKMTPTSHHTQNLNNSRWIIDSSENSKTIHLHIFHDFVVGKDFLNKTLKYWQRSLTNWVS